MISWPFTAALALVFLICCSSSFSESTPVRRMANEGEEAIIPLLRAAMLLTLSLLMTSAQCHGRFWFPHIALVEKDLASGVALSSSGLGEKTAKRAQTKLKTQVSSVLENLLD